MSPNRVIARAAHSTASATKPSPTPRGSKPALVSSGRRRVLGAALVLVAVVLVVLAPSVSTPYVQRLLVTVVITSLPIMSLSLLIGFAGQISLSQAAFAGFGAYAYSDLTIKLHWPAGPAMLAAVVAAYLLAWGIGRPILRLRGYYLAMATLGIGLIAGVAFNTVSSLTGGFSGISGIAAPTIFGLAFDTDTKMYYYGLVVAAIVFVVLWHLSRGDYGRRLRTMRESEGAARAYGVDVGALKAQVFAIASAVAALGGILYAQYATYISPDSFGIDISINYMLATVIGGLASIWGGVLGSIYLVLLPEAIQGEGKYVTAISGVIIIVIIGFWPGGLLELLAALRRRLASLMRSDDA